MIQRFVKVTYIPPSITGKKEIRLWKKRRIEKMFTFGCELNFG